MMEIFGEHTMSYLPNPKFNFLIVLLVIASRISEERLNVVIEYLKGTEIIDNMLEYIVASSEKINNADDSLFEVILALLKSMGKDVTYPIPPPGGKVEAWINSVVQGDV